MRDHLPRIQGFRQTKDVDLEALTPNQLEELAQRVMAVSPDLQWRRHILSGMTLVAFFDSEPRQISSRG